MKFKLDENLGKQTAEVLRAAGYDTATVQDQKLCGAADQTLIEICRSEGRCLITLDLEFGNPLMFDPADYPGIVVLRLSSNPSPKDLVDTIHMIGLALNQRDISGKLWVVQRNRIREYQPEE